MKILVIFILYLISGHVVCFDVIGYSGGSVIIGSDIQWDLRNYQNICKVNNSGCTNIIHSDTKSSSVQKDRFTLYKDQKGYLRMLIRQVNPEDAGEYNFQFRNETKYDINLTVYNDTCCGEPKAMNLYLGQNSFFICNYPVDNQYIYKYIYKLDNETTVKEVLGTFTKPQNGRFSISNDINSIVIVNISDVRETDGGVYLCGVRNKSDTVTYYTFFQEIRLHVIAIDMSRTSAAPTGIPSDVTNPSSSVIIITCLCVTLLLVGGSAAIFYLLVCRKTEGSTHLSMMISDNNKVPLDDHVCGGGVKPTKSESGGFATASGKNPDRQTCFTEQPEKEEDVKYATVSYLKNPDDATVTFSQEKFATEYGSVRYPTLE